MLKKNNTIYANLFAASKTDFTIQNTEFQIEQVTNYPWEGNIKFKISADKPVSFNLMIRVPGWAKNQPVPSDLYHYFQNSRNGVKLMINNELAETPEINGYLSLDRKWKEGDEVEIVLPMTVRKVIPNENVKDITGKVAIERGPIVYCAEQVDNPDGVLHKDVKSDDIFVAKYEPDLLQGVIKLESKNLTLVPYYAWSNRGLGEMEVWFGLNQ